MPNMKFEPEAPAKKMFVASNLSLYLAPEARKFLIAKAKAKGIPVALLIRQALKYAMPDIPPMTQKDMPDA